MLFLVSFDGFLLTDRWVSTREAALAQLGERQTEDLKVPGSIPGGGTFWQAGPIGPVERRRFPKPESEGSIPSWDEAPMV